MEGEFKHVPPAARRRELSIDDYYNGVVRHDMSVLARALTLVESNNSNHQLLAEELLKRLLPHTGEAIRVGITGAPGAGKSTFIEALGLNLVRQGSRVAAYLNGQSVPEFEGEAVPGCPADETSVFIGGRSDNLFNFEGKICQVAIYDRAISPEQVAAHHHAAVQSSQPAT